jgi:hypothetical protein
VPKQKTKTFRSSFRWNPLFFSFYMGKFAKEMTHSLVDGLVQLVDKMHGAIAQTHAFHRNAEKSESSFFCESETSDTNISKPTEETHTFAVGDNHQIRICRINNRNFAREIEIGSKTIIEN